MANYIVLESEFRDRFEYPNPAQFIVKASQLTGWFRTARTVRAHPQMPLTKPLGFVSSVDVIHVITPYNANLVTSAQLFMDIHSVSTMNDRYLVNAIEGRHRDARFVLILDKIQFDENGDPNRILWKSGMEQVLRIKYDAELFFRLFTKEDVTVAIADTSPPDAPDPAMQIFVLLAITPYSRDGDYDNHLLEYSS